MDEAGAGIVEVRAWLTSGEVSPESAIAEALRRCEEAASLNAFVELRDDGLAAPRDDVEGPLAGVPVAVKDMFADGGRAPSMGSRVSAAGLGSRSEVVERLRAAGAAIVGYTNLHEWAVGTTSVVTATGPIHNPWDVERIAGGSSGGSAAALAAGAVPGALGSDAGGSIRIPAACCGVVGLKPTWGAIPIAGFAGGDNPIDHVGPMARSARDARVLFEVLAGARSEPVEVGSLRVGLCRRFFLEAVDEEVEAATLGAADVLRGLGCEVREVELAGAAEAGPAAGSLQLAYTARTLQRELAETPEAFQPATLNVLMMGAALTREDLGRAEQVRTVLRRSWGEVFADVDVLLTPTLPAPPPRIANLTIELPSGATGAELPYLTWNAPMNLGGVPSLSLPCGDTRDRMPLSVSLTAARGRDAVVISLGEAFEAATEGAFAHRVASGGTNSPRGCA